MSDEGESFAVGSRIYDLVNPSSDSSTISNSIDLFCEYEKMRLRLAGVKPNSEAIRIIISACRFTVARYGD
jgi:hypothetical protein